MFDRKNAVSIRTVVEYLETTHVMLHGEISPALRQRIREALEAADIIDQMLDYRDEAVPEPLPTPDEVEAMCKEVGLDEIPF